MKTKIVRIGNSRGIRIPKSLLHQCHLDGPVEVDVQGNQLVVRSLARPRNGWEDAFRAMHQAGDDNSLTAKDLPLPNGIATNGAGSPPLRGLSRSPRSH